MFKPENGSQDRLFCAHCAKSANKKHCGKFLPMPTLKDINLSTWIQVNGPNFAGVCAACTHALEYLNYHMSHIESKYNKAPKKLENLLPSCLSCNNATGVGKFDEFIEARYPKSNLLMLSHKHANEAARVMLCRTAAISVQRNVLNHKNA